MPLNHHIILDEVASTNEFAIIYASKIKPPEGSVISAENQTKGRGQIGRVWVSEAKKNVLMSVIIYPNKLRIQSQFQLNIVLSLAIYDIVKKYCPTKNISIKWPNDIYIGDEKIAGLLVQLSITGNQINNVVLGVGLNVFQKVFPKQLPNPTSLSIHNNNLPSISILIEMVQQRLMEYYEYLMTKNSQKLKDLYEAKLYRRFIPSVFTTPEGAHFSGQLQGIDDQGRLILFVNGTIQVFSMSEVRMVI